MSLQSQHYEYLPEPSWWQRFELPTWILIAGVYSGWLLLVVNAERMSSWLLIPAAAIVLCLYGSLQHELIHNHPTRWPMVNALFGWAPLSLWMPYPRYRSSHTLHHRVDTLARPGLDPESYYWRAQDWQRLHPLVRALWRINYSFAGRMTVGPWLIISTYLIREVRHLGRGDVAVLRAWIPHLGLVALLLVWLDSQGISWWQYLLFWVWPGASLQLVRSYSEHRDFGEQDERSVIIEGSWLSRLLFLNNNFHQVHHQFPGMPWYRIHEFYRANRRSILARNNGFYFASYLDVIGRYLFRIKDLPVYGVVTEHG